MPVYLEETLSNFTEHPKITVELLSSTLHKHSQYILVYGTIIVRKVEFCGIGLMTEL